MTEVERFNENIRLAYRFCNLFCRRRNLYIKDYESAALAGLWHACNHYQDGKVRFSSYAVPCIVGTMKREYHLRFGFVSNNGEKFQWTNADGFLTNIPARPEPESHPQVSGELAALLRNLNARDRRIIELRFGLNGNPETTFEDCGKILRLTKERVRAIMIKILLRFEQYYPSALARWRVSMEDVPSGNAGCRWVVPEDTTGAFENAVRVWEDCEGNCG